MPDLTRAAAASAEIGCAPVVVARNFMGGPIVLASRGAVKPSSASRLVSPPAPRVWNISSETYVGYDNGYVVCFLVRSHT